MCKAQRRQKKYHDRTAVEVHYKVGDPVYVHNENRQSKLDDRWLTHFRIMNKTGPVSFVVRNQLTGDIRRVHADSLKLADLMDWPMPAPRQKVRKARYVVPPVDEDSDSDVTQEYMTAEESCSEDEVPLAKLKKRWAQS